jgi:hypothetical protein
VGVTSSANGSSLSQPRQEVADALSVAASINAGAAIAFSKPNTTV